MRYIAYSYKTIGDTFWNWHKTIHFYMHYTSKLDKSYSYSTNQTFSYFNSTSTWLQCWKVKRPTFSPLPECCLITNLGRGKKKLNPVVCANLKFKHLHEQGTHFAVWWVCSWSLAATMKGQLQTFMANSPQADWSACRTLSVITLLCHTYI